MEVTMAAEMSGQENPVFKIFKLRNYPRSWTSSRLSSTTHYMWGIMTHQWLYLILKWMLTMKYEMRLSNHYRLVQI